VLVIAGAICAVLVGGLTGQVLTIALMLAGLGGGLLLVFLEVGLSEEREQARDQERRQGGRGIVSTRKRLGSRRRPRRPT
jgi:hypothetical protein